MFGCRLPGANRRIKWSAKRVESSGVPCLDAGSTPATSTFTVRILRAVFVYGKGVKPSVLRWCAAGHCEQVPRPSPHHHASLRLCFCLRCRWFLMWVATHLGSGNDASLCGYDGLSHRSTPATSTFTVRILRAVFVYGKGVKPSVLMCCCTL